MLRKYERQISGPCLHHRNKRHKRNLNGGPHVAGLYAATKAAVPGISVNDATAWIVGSGSIPVQVSLPGSGGTQTYRRIRVTAL